MTFPLYWCGLSYDSLMVSRIRSWRARCVAHAHLGIWEARPGRRAYFPV